MGKILDTLIAMGKHHKLLLVTVLCVVITCFTGYLHQIAPQVGKNVGATTGNVVGMAIGSADGLLNGLSEGQNDGTDAGLSAEDTNAEIKGMFVDVGKLEVMSAGVTLKNIMQTGDAYKSIKTMKGNVIYTIDLSKVQISQFVDNSGYVISIPYPEMELYLDVNSTKTLAEKHDVSWSVDAEDGLIGYINSLSQMSGRVDEAMVNYDDLMEIAKEAATTQVEQLAHTFSEDGLAIEVVYQKQEEIE